MKTQSATRKSFRREGEDKRREDLIAATLECVAERGLAGATVREIALRADVTPGLIRYYFPVKDDLIGAAYRAVMSRMTVQASDALKNADSDPRARLSAFVTANLGTPIMDPIICRSGPALSVSFTQIPQWQLHTVTAIWGFAMSWKRLFVTPCLPPPSLPTAR